MMSVDSAPLELPAAVQPHARLAHAYVVGHPAEAARTLERHAARDTAPLLQALAPSEAATLLAQVESSHGAAILLACEVEKAGDIVSEMAVDAAARVLRRMEPDVRQPILDQCEPGAARALARTLDHPAHSAAGLMDARGVALSEDLTVGAALARARHASRWLGTYVYLTDETHTLTGVVSLRDLLAASPRAPLTSIMTRDPVYLRAHADRTTIVSHPGWRRYHEIPVVDANGILLGVVRYATVRRLEQDLAPARPPASGFAPLVAIGELYWIGMARVLGSLIAAVGGAGAKPTQERR
jgi:magnesium transporter